MEEKNACAATVQQKKVSYEQEAHPWKIPSCVNPSSFKGRKPKLRELNTAA